MRFNISAWSIRRPVPALVLFIILVALGILSFRSLPVTRLPNVDLPIISVTVVAPGAAPAELETQVTKTVEGAVASVAGVRHINSTVTDGASTTTVEFRLETDPDRALSDVRDAVARVRGDLPRNIEEPVVQRVEVAGLAILTYAATAPGKTVEDLSWFVDNVVKRTLLGLRGVASVERIGGAEREIRVLLDPDRLLATGLTAADVSKQLRGATVDLAGGRGELGGREESIRTVASPGTLQDLAATMIVLPGGGKLRLEDLGTVVDGTAEPRSFARLDGEPVVAFGIFRSKGASDVAVAKEVAAAVGRIEASNPDVHLSLIDSTVDYTLGNYHAAMSTLFEGAALAIVVVLIFLRDARATIVAAVALPLSILPAFWAMDVLGFSLNLVSLLAITLSTGILVDDAIVEIENISRHMRMGKSPYHAALEAADEIGLAVIAISLTIIAVFAPVSFMGGVAGQFFKQFGVTIAVAVFFSLLVARLVTPMLAAYALRPPRYREAQDSWLLRLYTRLVGWSVRHRILTVLLGLVLFAGSIASTTLLPKSFLPAEDTGRSLLVVELPPGSRLSDTQSVTDRITERLRARPEVQSVFVEGGRVPNGGSDVSKASLTVNYKPRAARALSQSQLEQAIGRNLADIPDIRYWFLDSNGQRAISLLVTGPEGAPVADAAARLASEMKRLPMLANVVSTAELGRPEIVVRPRPNVAADLGVSTEAISQTIRVATVGEVGANLPKFNAGGRLVPIRVQLPDTARTNRHLLEALPVPTARGGTVPLSAVADVALGQGPTSIERYDRARGVAVQADLNGRAALGEALARIYALPAAKNLPPGITVSESGDAEVMGELFDSFQLAISTGLLMVYGVLVLLFVSFLQPVTILFSLPLSIGGAILALLAAGEPLSMPVVIGILMLMGIVTKNAIMLVDFALEAMARGVPRRAAIVDAGRKRARPIVMTTVAMVAGMVPSAFAIGAGGEARAPMAIAVIGGLIVSTLLSLVFVPAFFALMDDISRLAWRLFGRFVAPREEAAEEAGGLAP